MALTEDLSAFTVDFGLSVTLDGVTVRAIFDANYELSSVGSIGMASAQPALTLATSDVPADPVGVSAVIGSEAYTVSEHRPDGTGVSVLILESA